MKPLRAAAGLAWKRPRVFQRRWQLHDGDDVVATLENPPAWGFRCTAETASGQWRLRHRGFLRGSVCVERRLAEGEWAERARFEPSWFGSGRLPREDGPLAWRRVDFWGRRWEFRHADGRAVVSFVRLPGLFRPGCQVEIAESARMRADVEELVLLGWFLVLLMARQAHAAM